MTFSLQNTIIGFGLVLWSGPAGLLSVAQEPALPFMDDNAALREQLEQMAVTRPDDADLSDLQTNLDQFADHRINLNNTGEEELLSLGILTETEVHNILIYLKKYGEMLSVYELQAVRGFDTTLIARLLPYITVEPVKATSCISLAGIRKYGKNQVLLRYQRTLEKAEGYRNDKNLPEDPAPGYLGSPDKVLVKYSFRYGTRLRWGFTAEKDAGEPFLTRRLDDEIRSLAGSRIKGGFDFYSAHACLQTPGLIRSLAVGDYHLGFGQGLTLWTGTSFGKSAEIRSVKKYGGGIRPCTSTDENGFLRGMALTLARGGFECTPFFSSGRMDANLLPPDTNDPEPGFSAFQETGYHRTTAEILDKDAVRRTLYGADISYKNDFLKVGLTGFRTLLDPPVSGSDEPYEFFGFTGSDLVNAGMHYSCLYKGLSLFGEAAVGGNGAWAGLTGLTAELDPSLLVTMLYRNYPKNYQNLLSQAFADGSSNANERGLFSGLQAVISPRVKATAFVDLFRFPWLKYNADGPTEGTDALVQVDYRVAQGTEVCLRYRSSTGQKNTSGLPDRISFPGIHARQAFRLHITHQLHPGLLWKSRAEYLVNRIADKNRHGCLLAQDLQYKPSAGPITLYLRYALFDTDSYDERLYAYEFDVPYAFSVPACYDKGCRYAMMLKYNLLKNMDLWIRFAQTCYAGKSSVGTGLDETEGNTRSDIKVQIRMKF
jgi:hypothetical protein